MTGSVKKLLGTLAIAALSAGCAMTTAENQLRMDNQSSWMSLEGDEVSLDSLDEGELSFEAMMQADEDLEDDNGEWEDDDLVSMEATSPGIRAIFNCPSRKIALQADNGRYLSRCRGCARSSLPDSATVHAQSITPSSIWTVFRRNGRIALQASTKRFLGRCRGCMVGSRFPDAAFVHATYPAPYTLWRVIPRANGEVALLGDSRHFLARCNGCAPGGPADRAFVHVRNPNLPWAQWRPVCIGQSGNALQGQTQRPSTLQGQTQRANPFAQCRSGHVALRASTGMYLSRCRNCGSGRYPDSATIHNRNKYAPYSRWRVVSLPGNRVALRSDTGRFLGRCMRCMSARHPNSAMVYGSGLGGPMVWTWDVLPNGRVTLRADTGQHLARCHRCAAGPPDRALVYHINPRAPDAQWVVECV